VRWLFSNSGVSSGWSLLPLLFDGVGRGFKSAGVGVLSLGGDDGWLRGRGVVGIAFTRTMAGAVLGGDRRGRVGGANTDPSAHVLGIVLLMWDHQREFFRRGGLA